MVYNKVCVELYAATEKKSLTLISVTYNLCLKLLTLCVIFTTCTILGKHLIYDL